MTEHYCLVRDGNGLMVIAGGHMRAEEIAQLCHQGARRLLDRPPGRRRNLGAVESVLVEEVLSHAGADTFQVGHVVAQLLDGLHLFGQVVLLDEVAHLQKMKEFVIFIFYRQNSELLKI